VSQVRLRAAAPLDAAVVFEWRNDPWIVSLSTSRSIVSWPEHQAWFARMLDRSAHLMYIIHADAVAGSERATNGDGAVLPQPVDAQRAGLGAACGTVRIDRGADGLATITIYLLRTHIGRGLGSAAIRLACAAAREAWPDLTRIQALIRADNAASLRSFDRAGFREPAADEARAASSVPTEHVQRLWSPGPVGP
jgi:RimJ/RimL family protein N-acetyltransferase